MTKTYQVIFDVTAPEGFDDAFDPYDGVASITFDDLFTRQGAEIQDIEVRELED